MLKWVTEIEQLGTFAISLVTLLTGGVLLRLRLNELQNILFPDSDALALHDPAVHDQSSHAPVSHASASHAPASHDRAPHAPALHAPGSHDPPLNAPVSHALAVRNPVSHATAVHARLPTERKGYSGSDTGSRTILMCCHYLVALNIPCISV